MMEACCHGYNDCVMLLHNAGASWSNRDSSGTCILYRIIITCIGLSVLHWAVDGEQSETVELLLSEGLQVYNYIILN